ncbi:MAG: outer membrane protein assembly factor BamA [Bauldia sp.]
MSFRSLRKAALALGVSLSAPAAFGIGSLLIATEANAATLTSVVVRGNSRVDTATIRSYVTVPIGQNFTQEDVNNTLLALFATGLFADVDVTGQGNSIVIVVVENAVVANVVFVGNDKVNDGDLAEIVQTAQRGVVSDVLIANDIRAIQDRYDQIGRAVTVTVDIQDVGGGAANVVFNVQEGDRTRIAGIDFVGNSAYSDRQLMSVIELRRSSLLSWLTKNDIYSADALARDSELLRLHYVENGYADFQVLSANAVVDPVTGDRTITFEVAEGPRYRFGVIGVDSTIPGVDAAALRGDIHTGEGRVFNGADIERTLEDISVTLAGMGHPFARVTPRGNRDYANNIIDITYVIDQGARAYIERIDVVGNERTRDYVIRREFDIAEGDAYNRVLVDRVERRLRNLGLFDGVAIVEQRGSAPDQVILVVQVQERRTGQVSATAGYSTLDGVLGEVSLTETNFLGRGQYLRVAFSIGRSVRNYTVSFTEPYFLGRRLSLGFDVFHQQNNSTGSRPFDQTRTGGAIRFGIPLTENLTAQLSYRLVRETITQALDGDGNPIPIPVFYPEGTTITSSISYGFTFSNLDNTFAPTTGIYIRANQELAGLGGNNAFLRTTGDLRVYRSIGDSPFVLAFRAQGGTITGRGQDVRVSDLFRIGGDTIRGFTATGIGPRTTGASDPANFGLGGRHWWAASAELRFPMPFIPEDLGFTATLFADAGTVYGATDGVALNGFPGVIQDGNIIRSSVGLSLGWASPFGNLRLDFAKVLSAADWDQQQAIRLGIGGEF